MPKPAIGKIVRYFESGQEWAALTTAADDTPEAYCHLTVFGIKGQSYRYAAYSETLKDRHWSWAATVPAKK